MSGDMAKIVQRHVEIALILLTVTRKMDYV